MDFLPRLSYGGGRNHAYWLGPVFGLVMASDMIAASVAAPERKRGEIWPVRIDLRTGCQPGDDIGHASAAIDFLSYQFRHD